MKAVIMAGGMGKRLRPVTGEKPKPLAPFLGRSLMEHILLLLKEQGFDEVCAAVGYKAGDIMAQFGDGSSLGIKLRYRLEDKPLGTAGAVKNCADFYGDEDFLVISADAVCDFDLARLMAEHKNRNALISLALYHHPEPLSYGLCISDSQGWVHSFVEKPSWPQVVTDLVNTGIYIISPKAMDFVPSECEFDFAKDLFPRLLKQGRRSGPSGLLGVEMEGYWCDVGSPLSYYRCCADALEGKVKLMLPESFQSSSPAEADEERAEGMELKCRSRAELMGRLSLALLDMGADYSDGLSLSTERYFLSIHPFTNRSALCISVNAPDAEFARRLCLSAKELAQALDSD